MMRCPICGEELKLSKKNPGYALCHNCRKKFRLPKKVAREVPKPDRLSAPQAADPSIAAPDDEMTDRTQVFSREEVRAALHKANSERKAEKAARRAAKGRTSGSVSKKAGTSAAKGAYTPQEEDDGEYHFRYANIPPKEVREKQEREMRKAYDELLSIGEEERSFKRKGLFGRKK